MTPARRGQALSLKSLPTTYETFPSKKGHKKGEKTKRRDTKMKTYITSHLWFILEKSGVCGLVVELFSTTSIAADKIVS